MPRGIPKSGTRAGGKPGFRKLTAGKVASVKRGKVSIPKRRK